MLNKMKSILIKSYGGAEQLFFGQIPLCKIVDPSDVIIRTMSIGLNRMDILQREGRYPVPEGASPILGVEVSGYVHETQSKFFSKGDRVMALVSGGAYSEYVIAPDSLCMKIPSNLTFEQAASIPENWLTAFQLLHFITNVKKGSKVLIHAAASGVGCAAIQLCKIAGAGEIIATSRNQSKLEICQSLGATFCINTQNVPEFSKEVLNYTDAKGVDIILDPIGSSYFDENFNCCAKDAIWILYGLMGGSQINNFNLAKLMSKRISFCTTTLRSRSLEYRVSLIKNFSKLCLHKFEDGSLKTVIDKTFYWENVKDSHLYMESNSNAGKIVLNTNPLTEE